MRYLNIETLTFEDSRRRKLHIKEMREITPGQAAYVVDRGETEPFDLVASRDDVYGEGGERQAWRLHDSMAVELVDRRFDYSFLRKVRVT